MRELKIPPEELPFRFDGMENGDKITFATLESPGVYEVYTQNEFFSV